MHIIYTHTYTHVHHRRHQDISESDIQLCACMYVCTCANSKYVGMYIYISSTSSAPTSHCSNHPHRHTRTATGVFVHELTRARTHRPRCNSSHSTLRTRRRPCRRTAPATTPTATAVTWRNRRARCWPRRGAPPRRRRTRRC